MLDEIYTWLESYAGVSYDFDESVQEIDASNAFIDPFNWKVSIEIILSQLDDACDIIDEFWKDIYKDGFPSSDRSCAFRKQDHQSFHRFRYLFFHFSLFFY